MNVCQSALYITTIACQLFNCMDTDELASLAADFVQLGDTLDAMIARSELCDSKADCCINPKNNCCSKTNED